MTLPKFGKNTSARNQRIKRINNNKTQPIINDNQLFMKRLYLCRHFSKDQATTEKMPLPQENGIFLFIPDYLLNKQQIY